MADKPLGWLNPRGPSESAAFAAMDPAIAEQCKLQLVQQHSLFKQQTAALASAVQLQVQLANELPVFIEEDGKTVQVWNPLEAVKAEIDAAQAEGALCHILVVQTVKLKIVLLCCNKPLEEQLQLNPSSCANAHSQPAPLLQVLKRLLRQLLLQLLQPQQ